MTTDQRRAAGRRRAWGRGPIILRFEPLEGRQLLSANPLPDLVGRSFDTPGSLAWGQSFHAQGVVANQGNAAATSSFHVDIYATTAQGSTLLGEATIPAGLQPGTTASFDQTVTLPATPLAGIDASGAFYIKMVVDPQNQVAESNEGNNAGAGAGIDYTLETIAPRTQAALVGSGTSISSGMTEWGGSVQLTQHLTNVGTKDAPATRALLVLTPAGVAPGGSADVSLGSVNVPPVAAGQTVTVSPTFDLPATAPTSLAGVTNFTLSVVPDGDYALDQMYPHTTTQGTYLDSAPLTINTPSFGLPAAAAAQPDLVVANVGTPVTNSRWGQSIQVAATIANQGKGDIGPFRVRFLLVGNDGSFTNSLFLTDSSLSGLAAGTAQNIETTLKLPSSLPDGTTLNSLGIVRIAVVADPENTVNEPSKGNNVGVSGPVTLSVVGTDGTSTPVAGATASTQAAAAATTKATPATTAKAVAAAKAKAAAASKTKMNKIAAPTHTFQHNLSVFPKNVGKFFTDTLKKL